MASLTSRLAGWAAGRLKGEKARKKTMEFIDETGVGKLLSLAGDAALLSGAGKLAGAAGRAVGAKLGIGGAGAAGASATGGTARLPFDSATAQRQAMLPNDLIDVNPVSRARDAAIARGAQAAEDSTFWRTYANAPRNLPSFGEDALARATTSATNPAALFRGTGVSDMARQNTANYFGAQPSVASRFANLGGSIGGAARAAGSYLAKKPEVAGMALSSLSQSRQAAANRELEREAMQQGQRQFEETMGLRKREEERDVERQRRIAEMLAPLFQRVAGGQR